MKKFKKILALTLSTIIVLTMLAGCGSKVEEVSDTVRWFNATCAILTEKNGGDHNMFGGMKPGEESAKTAKDILEQSWNVTDRASADENLKWILEEGHRKDFVELMEMLKSEGAEQEAPEDLAQILSIMENDENAGYYLVNAFYDYLEYGANAIDAWDYSRAMSLLGWYSLAGYYTQEEALDKALELGKKIQKEFSSWDEFVASYCLGFEFWSYSDSTERVEIYEKLKAQENGPYQVAWDTALEKTW